MRTLPLLLAGSIFASTAGAAGWELHENSKTGQQAATCTVTGTGPEDTVKATLVVHHPRGMPLKVLKKKDVTELPILVELCVDDYRTVHGFDFEKFEGPDAPAAAKRLVSITIKAGKRHFAKRFAQGGWINHLAWLLPDQKLDTAVSPKGPDDFTFGLTDPIRDLPDFITITTLLQQSPTKIAVVVTDSKNFGHTLRFDFATDHIGEVMGKLMR